MIRTKKVGGFIKGAALLLAAVLLFETNSVSAKAVEGNTVEEQVYNFLKKDLGVTNDAAVAGMMANIEQCSAFDPKTHANDAYGERYGLCLWYGARLRTLKSFCKKNGYDWQSTEGQLQFIKYEWSGTFSNIDRLMHNRPIHQEYNYPDTAEGAFEFGTFLSIQYIRCFNTAEYRARDYYYARVKSFAGATPAPAPAQAPAPAPAPAPAQAATPAPAQAAGALPGNTVEEKIFHFAKEQCGITNDAGIAGLLAEIKFVSDFNPQKEGNDSIYGYRYGLCQWYGTRLENLKSYCNRNGYDWHGADGQIRFMKYEWDNYYQNIDRYLHNRPNNKEYLFADSAEGAQNVEDFLGVQYVMDNACNLNGQLAGEYYSRVRSMSGK